MPRTNSGRINSASTHLVIELSGYVQVPLAANHSLVEATQHLQRVAQVSAGFGFSQQVADRPAQRALREQRIFDIVSVVELLLEVQPGQGEVMSVELLGLSVVVQVKVRVAQLAVDGAQHLQVLGSHLDGGFKEGDACPVVAHLAEPLTLQSEFQAGDLHPAADRSRVRRGGLTKSQTAVVGMLF